MSDQLTATIQNLESQYQKLKIYFASDGQVTPDEQRALSVVQMQIVELRRQAQERSAKIPTEGGKEVKKDVSKEVGKKTSTKNGFEAGVVGGLHANVSCKVGNPVGNPRKYPVAIKVSFGASAKVSGGAGKGDGSKVSVGVELKGSVERTMTQTHMLGEEELGSYLAALQAASKGSKVAAKQAEIGIIAVGVSQSWDAARQMWETFSGKGIKADAVQNKGDSIEITENRTGGAGVNLKAGPIGGGAGVKDSQEKTTKVTRNDKDTLDVDTKTSNTRETNLSGSMSVGVAGVEIGSTHTVKTSFGYSISVDPKKDPDGKILEWLHRCTTSQQYEVFIASNYGKVTVTGRTIGQSKADADTVGVSIAGVKASIGTNSGVAEESSTDGKGNLVKKTVVGEGGAGGKVPGHSDSVKDEAVAEIDGKGKAQVTLTRTKTDGTVDKSVRALSNEDLKRIGVSACKSLDYWMSAGRPRADDKKDWRDAGIAIARAKGAASVVGEQLARYVGGGPIDRAKTIENLLRGSNLGRKSEFPESIQRLQKSYEVVTSRSLPGEMDKLAKSDPAAAIDKCKGLLKIADLLDPQIRNNGDFENNATKMEMLQRLVDRRALLAEAIKGFSGQRKLDEDPALLEQAAERLQKQLSSFSVEQAKVGEKLQDLLEGDTRFLTRRLAAAKELIRQLNDMHRRWKTDYAAMKQTMAKRGIPNWNMPMLQPDGAMLARFEKAAGL